MFTKYLLATFLSPVYFFLRGRPLAGAVHAVFYVIALFTLMFGVGFFIWFILACHATWDLYHLAQERMADKVAEKVAARMGQQQ